MFNKSDNYRTSFELAAGGFVLLKNEEKTLPLSEHDNIAIVGDNNLHLIKGGGGSADVRCEYVTSLQDGLLQMERENSITLNHESLTFADGKKVYSVDELNEIANVSNKAIITFCRYSSEGADRKAYDYELTEEETDILEAIEKSNFNQVIIILNIASTMKLSFLEKYKKITAALLVYLPGMEGGRAIAETLCGKITPSGKLADTIARNYIDYPASYCFDAEPFETNYEEDIFVGYRYFETFCPEKVLYPFGFGLSYTEFEYSNKQFSKQDDKYTLSVDVKNIGDTKGAEIVEFYVTKPSDRLKQSVADLVGYDKTRVLNPGESENICIEFTKNDIASFDDTGVTGHKGAYVLEKGRYEFNVGKNVRNREFCGVFTLTETEVVEQLVCRFDGSEYPLQDKKEIPCTGNKGISLYDVTEGRATMEDFVGQLSVDELIRMSTGQPPMFALGTAGVGNLPDYGVPSPQTADGPAGIRRSIPTTAFPCPCLLACSFDKKLQFAMGKAMGIEGLNTGVDILLAPGLNIHRHILCGRNFEYYSEDPLVSGKTAAAIVKGVQSEGLCATVKHFAANNRENNRFDNSSNVSERALREIYLKGFSIVVKEANPTFVMTSYNLLNHVHTSTNAQLLRGVLRDEWGFKGAVMTDWRTHTHLDDEILAGNNIKMPFGYPDELEIVKNSYNSGKLTLAVLQQNAIDILNAVSQTSAYKNKYFGIIHRLDVNDITSITATEINGTSSTRVLQKKDENGMEFLYHLTLDQRKQKTYIFYNIDCPCDGDYLLSVKVASTSPEGQIRYFDKNENCLACLKPNPDGQWQDLQAVLHLTQGFGKIKILFEPFGEPDFPYNPTIFGLIKEDFQIGEQRISYIK